MMSADLSRKLVELDRLVNDPNVLLDAARVRDLLDQLTGAPQGWGDVSTMSANRVHH